MKRNWSATQLANTQACLTVEPEAGDKCRSPVLAGVHKHFKPAEHDDFNHGGSETSQDENDPSTLKVRVGVSSKVNFTKLSTKEKYLRYHNQANEIACLRKSLRQYVSGGKKPRPDVAKVLDKLKGYKHELEDQADLVLNLTRALSSGKLVPNSLAYNQICTILRDVLAISYPSCKHHIRLPETTVAVTSQEYSQYSELPCTAQIFRLLIGRKQEPLQGPEQQLLSLHRQMAGSHDCPVTPTHLP